jgi:hypothetical protein
VSSFLITKKTAPNTAQQPTPQASEVPLPDPLSKATQVIENLGDEAAALGHLHNLLNEQVRNDFELGGVLLRMKEKEWFSGYNSFEEMWEQKFGFKKSKAYYLISIYKVLRDLGVPWNDVKTLGGSKLRLVCAAAVAKNFDANAFSTCVEKAKLLTVVQLETELKGMPGTQSSKPMHLTLKPDADQRETIEAAIAKAKAMSGTSSTTVAIENICIEYLGHSPRHGPVSPMLAD